MREYLGSLKLVTPPASTPVDRETEVKPHVRVDGNEENTQLDRLIAAARLHFEEIADKTLFTTTWRMTLDQWPALDMIELPRPPLQSVTSITYINADGDTHTFDAANYYVVTDDTPGYIALNSNASWPGAALRPRAAIAITYVAGWANVADIPAQYKEALLLLIGHWYENREAIQTTGAVPKSLPLGFDSILLASRTN